MQFARERTVTQPGSVPVKKPDWIISDRSELCKGRLLLVESRSEDSQASEHRWAESRLELTET